MGISASHATELRLWQWRAETPTPDPPLKVTFLTWCGWDTTICGEHSSADFWPHCEAGRGNLHPGVTQWLLAGEISAQGTEMEKMRGTTGNQRQEKQLHTCLHFLVFFNPSYFANCSQQHHFPTALSDILGCCTNTRGVCTTSSPRHPSQTGNARPCIQPQALHNGVNDFYWLTEFLSAPSQDVKVVKPQGLMMCREKNKPSLGQEENLPEVLLNSNRNKSHCSISLGQTRCKSPQSAVVLTHQFLGKCFFDLVND